MKKITTALAGITLAATMVALAPTGAMAEQTTCTLKDLQGDWSIIDDTGIRRFSGRCVYECENGHTVFRHRLAVPEGVIPEGRHIRGGCDGKTIVVGPGEYAD